MKNLRIECERIQAKDKGADGLTPGQASTLVRNEQAIDTLEEEIEELDDTLNEMVADSLSDRRKVPSRPPPAPLPMTGRDGVEWLYRRRSGMHSHLETAGC